MVAASAGLFNDPYLSDVTIRQICGGEKTEYHGHKAVLCAHSEYFMRMFSGNFKEADRDAIEIEDDDPIHFEVMLKYIYNLEFDTPSLETWATDASFEQRYGLPIGVFALADKYRIKKLKEVAVEKLPSWCDGLQPGEAKKIVDSHYTTCVQGDCSMGRAIAQRLLGSGRSWVIGSQFQDALKRYPNLGADVLLSCSLSNGWLW